MPKIVIMMLILIHKVTVYLGQSLKNITLTN